MYKLGIKIYSKGLIHLIITYQLQNILEKVKEIFFRYLRVDKDSDSMIYDGKL